MTKVLIPLTAALVLCGAAVPATADTVVLHGSNTVMQQVIVPHRAAVEKSTGHTLEITASGSGKGLVSLVNGKCDASMSSDDLDAIVPAAEKAGAKVDPKRLMFHLIKKDEFVFIVHPSNPVSSLSWDQVKDIHTGKITNWKQVGGKDMPITVHSEVATGGNGAIIKGEVLGGADFPPLIKVHDKPQRVYELVKGDEKAFGGLGKGLIADSSKTKTIQTKKLERPLAFVTLGEPAPKVKQVIDAFKAAAK